MLLITFIYFRFFYSIKKLRNKLKVNKSYKKKKKQFESKLLLVKS